MKILVLENLSGLDAEMHDYLVKYKKEHPKDKVDVVYSVQRTNKDHLLKNRLSKCDCLLIQSTFSDRGQMREIGQIAASLPNIKEIKILYTYTKTGNTNEFLYFLNFKIDAEMQEVVKKICAEKKLTEVLFVSKENKDDEKKYFKTIFHYFDEVSIYYNEKSKVFWHVRKPDFVLPGDSLYLQKYRLDVDSAPEKYIPEKKILKRAQRRGLYVEPGDRLAFKSMVCELRAVIDNQIESCETHDFGHSKELIEEKQGWLNLIDKYKLYPKTVKNEK